ncbi:hypothetical protein [Kineococcus sp. SYSU DK024]|uniref:hypothetical protein n=1 Tax=Kineococcus sp. SYSU DK024 TaxID=3383145 RepID=UPI003D7C9134
MTGRDVAAQPPSPWKGFEHETRHRWQLDSATDLSEAAAILRELVVAHTAGWWLVEPMVNGHLLAVRASR